MSLIKSREIESVVKLTAPERYTYFIKKAADLEEIWSLKNKEGWVLASDSEGHEIVPVWSHAEYAKLCTNNNWRDCSPEVINLRDWIDKWIPGMTKDNRKIAVFPTIVINAVVVEPGKLLDDLNAELSKME